MGHGSAVPCGGGAVYLSCGAVTQSALNAELRLLVESFKEK